MERSGLRWVSYQTAAKKLGCSVEEIDQFVTSHLVRSLNDGEARFVAEGDLDDLVQIKEAPPVNTVHLARNQALIMERLERLEEAINLLYEANGLTSFRMGHLEDQTLVELAANIEQMLEQPTWALPRLLSCAEVFLKLTHVEVERLNELTGNPNAWRPFMELCLKQQVWLSRQPALIKQYDWARAVDLLNQGRKNLNQLMLFYCWFNQDMSPIFDIAKSVCTEEGNTLDILVLRSRKNPTS
jgi:DNA-binding transcriptional MerR regulator